MLPEFCRDVITRERAPFKTERGTKTRDWESDDIDVISISRCSVQDRGVAEDYGRAENVTSNKILYAPLGADVQAGDRITHDGKRYEVVGEPAKWISPTRRRSSLQAGLIKWKG